MENAPRRAQPSMREGPCGLLRFGQSQFGRWACRSGPTAGCTHRSAGPVRLSRSFGPQLEASPQRRAERANGRTSSAARQSSPSVCRSAEHQRLLTRDDLHRARACSLSQRQGPHSRFDRAGRLCPLPRPSRVTPRRGPVYIGSRRSRERHDLPIGSVTARSLPQRNSSIIVRKCGRKLRSCYSAPQGAARPGVAAPAGAGPDDFPTFAPPASATSPRGRGNGPPPSEDQAGGSSRNEA